MEFVGPLTVHRCTVHGRLSQMLRLNKKKKKKKEKKRQNAKEQTHHSFQPIPNGYYIGLAMSFLEKENEKWRGWKSKHDGYMSLTALNYVTWQIEVLDGKNAWLVVLYGWNPWCMDTRAIDVKATWHPRGLSELQGILNGNILHFTFDSSQGTPIWKESRKEGTFIRIFFHKERSFGPRNRVGFILL